MSPNDDTRPRILVAMDFDDATLAHLQQIAPDYRIERHFPDVPDSAWADAEVLYTMRHFPQPEQAPHLRWVQLHFAGMDRALTQPIIQKPALMVTSASGIHAVQMAEFSLMMILAANYRLPHMQRFQAKATWPDKRFEIFAPRALRGQRLGIVGYGSIGRELARQADALGMIVLASKRDARRSEEQGAYAEADTGDPAGSIPARIYPAEALESMAADCDYLVVTTPLTAETRGSINAAVFQAMPEHAWLVNVGRGPVVDEAALIDALKRGLIAGAALDVFDQEPLPADSPLWDMPNVIISPHVSGYTTDYNAKAAALFTENLRRYVQGQTLLNLLNRERGY